MRVTGLILTALIAVGCSSGATKKQAHSLRPIPKDILKSPAVSSISEPLLPAGRPFNAQSAPVIRHLVPGGIAQRHGFLVNDRILQINGEHVRTIAEFEKKMRRTNGSVNILFARSDERRNATVILPVAQKFGAEFAPFGVQLIRTTSPMVSFYKNGTMTVHAQGSYDEERGLLRFNFVIESSRPMKRPKVLTTVSLKGQKSVLASTIDTIDALGSSPVVFSKSIARNDRPKGPLKVSLAINQSNFLFEFQ
jgi:hypothetical protein